jgi:predicted Zn-dependent peptidase
MTNSFIAKKDLDSEMTVVRNEMEMGENDPGRILWQRTLAMMFSWHNYGKDTIGARSDVENVDIGRLQAFYRNYYQPDNATLTISGKFDVTKTLSLVAKQFGPIAPPSAACSACTRSIRLRTVNAVSRCAASAARRCCSWAITCRRPPIVNTPLPRRWR